MADDNTALVPTGAEAQTDTLAIIRAELERSPEIVSANTRRTYGGALARFETWRQGDGLRRPLTKLLIGEYLAHMRDLGLSSATQNHALSALRWWGRRLADLAAEDPNLPRGRKREIIEAAERAATVKDVKGTGPQRGRHVDDGEVRALLAACVADDTPSGTRDAAMISLAFATGARRAEIGALERADVTPLPDGHNLAIRKGKGGKHRTVALFGGAARYLGDWLQVRGEREGALFLAIRKGGAILGHGLGGQAMQEMLGRRAAEAGVSDLGWHDARRTFAGQMFDNGVDASTTAKILGHSSIATTGAYDRRPEETRRKALRARHIPYLRK